MTPRYTQAITLAAEAHEGQKRKGTAIPYITHPVEVAELVARYGGTEDQQIAGLLHDVLEDGGEQWASRIAEFGYEVMTMVRDCTDGIPDATGRKTPWRDRKEAYLEHLAGVSEETLLVSACDKLHNIQSINRDLSEVGVSVFDRFTADQAGTLWYYCSLVEIFESRRSIVAPALRAELEEIRAKLA